jgi:hypothetical protein
MQSLQRIQRKVWSTLDSISRQHKPFLDEDFKGAYKTFPYTGKLARRLPTELSGG